MQKFKRYIGVILALALMLVIAGVGAQENPDVAFAGVQDGKLTLFGLGDAPLALNNPPNKGISSVVWSPDGNKLAYILADDQFQAGLYVADVTTGADPIKLETGAFAAGFPVAFTGDGRLIYIGQSTTPTDPAVVPQVTIYRIAPEAGAQPETLGSFDFMAGCGGGGSLPSLWRYWEDAGYGGSGQKVILTEYGLLHNTNCSGAGLAILDLETGQDTPIGSTEIATADGQATEGTLGRIALSPDGKTLAAVRFRPAAPDAVTPFVRSLALVDLPTLAVTDVQTAEQPDQLAWNNDGTRIFYSAITENGNLLDGLTEEQLSRLAPLMGFDQNGQMIPVPGYQSTIHQYTPANGEDQLLYTTDAYAFGRMTASPDGQHLYASQIANLNAWVTAIADGTLDLSSGVATTDQAALVPVTVYQIPLVTRDAPLPIAENVSQFALRPSRQ